MSKKIEKKSKPAKDEAELDEEEENLDDEEAEGSEEDETDEDEDESADEEDDDSDDSDEDDSDDDDSPNSENVDWREEAKKERERRKNAERALAEKRWRNNKKKKDQDDEEADDEEGDDPDRPVTLRDLETVLSRRERTSNADRIREVASDLTGDPDKAEYIIEIHANRTFPSDMSLREQLEESLAIADRKHLVSKNSELKRALRSRDLASRNGGGSHRKGNEGTHPKVEKSLEQSLKNAGFAYDPKMKFWKKKLPSGQHLFKDARTKPVKTWVA
jgi:hypothetical protein